jgi:nitrogenase subunit NifH
MAVYDSDGDLVAIGKFSQPLTRKYNSDVLIIQATIDF